MTIIWNVVLVHGAWADASSWSKLIPLLLDSGLKVTAVQLPLTSFEADVEAVTRGIALAEGPVVLIGHSYGGAVITQAGNDPKVASLVYVDGFAPDAGESAGSLFAAFETAPLNAEIRPEAQGVLKLSQDNISNMFAQDLTDAEKVLLFVTQGPINAAALGGVVSEAAWKAKPVWYLVGATDQAISKREREKMAVRMGATIAHADASHVAMLAKPEAVARLVLQTAA